MLKDKSITFYVKRYAMSNVYLSIPESQDLIRNLTTGEYMLYTTVKGMIMEKPSASALKNPSLAKRLNVAEKTIANTKASLKKKGYLVITFGKDGDGDLTAHVHIGKEQVELYNLGLKVEISNAKGYSELLKKFPINDPSLTDAQRAKLVEDANTYYADH